MKAKGMRSFLVVLCMTTMFGAMLDSRLAYGEPDVNMGATVSPLTVPAGIPNQFTITITNNGPDSIGMVSISMGAAWGTPNLLSITIDGTPVSTWQAQTSGPGLLRVWDTGNPSNDLQVGKVMVIILSVTAPSSNGQYPWTITGNRNRGLGGPTINVIPSILVIPEIPFGTLGTIIAMTLALAGTVVTSRRTNNMQYPSTS